MKDGIIKGDGTSRLARSVADFKSRYPTYDAFAAALAEGTLPLDVLFNESGWSQLPDFLNKANLLKDSTAALYGKDETAVPDDVFSILAAEKNIKNFVIERIYTSQEWIAPKAANQEFYILAVGGGGAGKTSGGGSGYIERKTVIVPEETSIDIVCGAGAVSGVEERGGTTSFGDLVTALGGFSGDGKNGGDGEAGGGGANSADPGNGGNGNVYGGGGGGCWDAGLRTGGGYGGNGGKYGGGGGATRYAPDRFGKGGKFGGNGGGAGDSGPSSPTAVLPEAGKPWVGPWLETLYIFGLSLKSYDGLAGTNSYGGGGGGGFGGNGGRAANSGGGGGGYGGNGGYDAGGGGGFGGNGGDNAGGGGGFFCNGGTNGGGGGGFFSDGGNNSGGGGNGGVMIMYFKEDEA